jgi:K+-sensing histidine kinase KdpD
MCVVEVLRAGSPYREIIEVAEQSDVDLIILGTHGRTGLSRLVIGSTAERVVRHAPCPALVVRQRKHPPHERHSACQETNARRKNQRNATAPSA